MTYIPHMTLYAPHSLSSLVPGPVSNISSVSSFFMITITWEEPEMPNGIIAGFEVVYGLAASPQSSRTEDVTLVHSLYLMTWRGGLSIPSL